MTLINILQSILDYIFPRDSLTKQLETMSCDDFCKINKVTTTKQTNFLAPFVYHDPLVRRAIWEIKYGNNRKVLKLVAKALSRYLLEYLQDELPFTESSEVLLIPIPLSTKRRRERGFNQTELLATELNLLLPKLFTLETTMLIKKLHTLSQTKTLGRRERLHNIEKSFAVVHSHKIHNKYIILLDDVITTGATMREAAGALLPFGPRRIFCIALAH